MPRQNPYQAVSKTSLIFSNYAEKGFRIVSHQKDAILTFSSPRGLKFYDFRETDWNFSRFQGGGEGEGRFDTENMRVYLMKNAVFLTADFAVTDGRNIAFNSHSTFG